MKNAIILASIVCLVSTLIACGGSTKEKETPKTQTNTVAANSNTISTTPKNEGDADDAMPTNSANSVTSNATKPVKAKDKDDKRTSNSRVDADDRGKKDSDGDDDDS